ncbi:MAG: hypothetical protein ACK4JX_05935 [Flavobacterium sp.]
MKKILLSIILFGFTMVNHAQDASVEKSIFGIQTGLVGIWAHHEAKLNNSIALRSEIGLDAGFSRGIFSEQLLFIMAPTITLEPRWYYNLERRAGKNKRIDGNSGNFISLKTSYVPDWFVISNFDNVGVIEHIELIPTYGIKRNIGKHWQYEAGFGIGPRLVLYKQYGFDSNNIEIAGNLHVRIGYRF